MPQGHAVAVLILKLSVERPEYRATQPKYSIAGVIAILNVHRARSGGGKAG